jgi:transcriptional regulator with XRE-family HTH domain|tara:strand:+ start:518 stop:724 length:207 start_codon:yes stop_codon:yes gene_type:complete
MENQMTPKRLQALREVHGVSQSDVAKFLGYSVNGKPNRSMIARFENGHAKINPRISMLLNSYFSAKSA